MTARHARTWAFAAITILLCAQAWAQEPKAGTTGPDPKFIAFAKQVEAGITGGNPQALDSALDWNAFMLRILPDKGIAAEDRRDVQMGMKKTFKLGQEIVRAIEAGGSFKLIKVYLDKDKPHALFRFLMDSGGMNYYDLALKLNSSGEVKYEDIYTYTAGEDISATMRRIMLPFIAQLQKNLLEKLISSDGDYMKNITKLADMSKNVKAGKPEAALKIFNQLPEKLRKDKTVLLVRLQAAAAVSTDSPEYQKAMDDFEKLFPNDPATLLVLIDSYLNKKQYDKMMATIDALDKKVGGDPYLEIMRATCLMLQKKHTDARAAAERAIKKEPTLTVAYYNILTIAMDEKNWPEVAKGLTRLEKEGGIKLNDLTTVPEYAEFVKSPEFKKWLAGRPPKKTTGEE